MRRAHGLYARCLTPALLPALLAATGCYESHERPPTPAPFEAEADPVATRARVFDTLEPVEERPLQEVVVCDAEPTRECIGAFPRVMIVMDASSSMLGGVGPGTTNWDKARIALAGSPDSAGPEDPGYVQPAFEREIEVQGNLVTMEDVFHLGMLAFNNDTAMMLQYAPCASDNVRWAMDPYVSCELPGCSDPYVGMPQWTFKASDRDRDPPFVQTTYSYMPPCNGGGAVRCVGAMYNTDTELGLLAAAANIVTYRDQPGGFELDPSTPFAIILITDGETSPDSSPIPVLRMLRERGIDTYVIGLEPQSAATPSPFSTREQLDTYADHGGTGEAVLIEADEANIADAFADAVERILVTIGTDPCCLPNDCSEDPEPR